MRKTLLICFLSIPAFVWAQEGDENKKLKNDLKPIGGEKTLELQFTPFGDSPININGIRGRWFKDQKKAFRLNVFVGLNMNTEITQQEDSNLNLVELKDKTSTYAINIRPGIERHLKGTKRLSPYFGAEVDLAYQYSVERSEAQNGTDVNYYKIINNNGFYRLGANAIAGVDFYLSNKFYLGTEIGFGFNFTKLTPIKIKSDASGFTEPNPIKRGSSFDVGPNVNAQIRLGYAF